MIAEAELGRTQRRTLGPHRCGAQRCDGWYFRCEKGIMNGGMPEAWESMVRSLRIADPEVEWSHEFAEPEQQQQR
jgi:hypothetical protein